MRMYAGQAGRNGVAPGDAMLLLLRPAHGVALALGLACVVAPAVQPWIARRIPSFATRLGAQWPLPAFLLSYALIASRGAVPFLYFQF